jgi:chitinase
MRSRARLSALVAAAVAVAAAGALAFTMSAASAATNTIANPGFETGSLSSWTCDASASAGTGHAHSGTYQLTGAAGADTAQCAQTVAVAANTSYTLTAWVQGSYVFVGVSGGASASTWTSSTGYSQLSVTFNSGSATSVSVFVHGWYGQGTYYADDFVMNGPGGNPSPSVTSASPSRSPSASPSASPSKSPSASPSASPSKSASPSPSTSSTPPTGTLPRHELTGYWQDFTNGATALRLRDVPTSYDLIAIAFANADPSKAGGVTFSVDSGLSSALGGYSDADLRADVSTLHSRGQHVILSVGGQNGSVSVGDSTAAANFANSVYSIMTSFGFDGIDIDLENGVNASAMASALHQLAGKVGSSLIVTLAPQTIDMQSTGTAYFQLALNIKDILTVVHTQYYNSGSMLGCDQMFAYSQGSENFLTALACIQLQSALRPDQVALGLPASGSAAGGGYTSPSVINAALDCLARGTNCGTFKPASTWPAIRGVMTWSINWDASSGYAFANAIRPHLATLP